MVDIREMIVRISAVDTATSALNNVRRLANSDTVMTLRSDVSSLTNARHTVENVVRSIPKAIGTVVHVDTRSADKAVRDAASAITTATNTMSTKSASDMSKLSGAMDQVTTRSEKLRGAWSAVTQVGSGMSKTINGVTDSIDTATIAIGAITAIGTNQVFRASSLMESLGENYEGEELFKVQEYIRNRERYVSEDTLIRGLVKTKQRGLSLNEGLQMAETLGQVQFTHAGTWQEQGLNLDIAMERVNNIAAQARSAIKAGNELSGEQIQQLATIGFGEVKKKDLNEAYSQLMSEGAVKGKAKGEDLDRIFRRALLNTAQKNMKDIDWDNLSVSQQLQIMKTQMEDLRSTIALKVVPVLVNVVTWITKIIDVINAIPGATKFIAYTTVLTTVAVVASRLAGTFGVLTTAIKGATAAFAMYNKVSMANNTTSLAGQAMFIGPKKGLNAPLMRSRAALEGVELIGDSGIVAKMRKSFTAAAGDSRNMSNIISGAFRAMATVVKASFKTMTLAAMQFFLYLLANPLVAIAAIIVAVVLLAYKFGYLQRAWDKFANSNFGKDVLWFFAYLQTLIWATIGYIDQMWDTFKKGSGSSIIKVFDSVASVIGDIFDKFDAFYTAIKKGDLRVTIGAAGSLIESLGQIVPMFAVISAIYKLFKEAYETFKSPVMIIRDILSTVYDAIVGLWKWFKEIFLSSVIDVLLSIPALIIESLRSAAPSIFGSSAKTGSDLDEKIIEAVKKIGGMENMTDEQKQWIIAYSRKYGLGETGEDIESALGGKTSSEMGFSSHHLDAGEEAAVTYGQDQPGTVGTISSIMSEGGSVGPVTVVTDKTQVFWKTDGTGNGLTEDEYNTMGRPSGYYYSSSGRDSTQEEKIRQKEEDDSTRYDSWTGYIPFVGNPDVQNAVKDIIGIGGADVGGLIRKSGLVYVHSGEPIVPADIASSSVLLDRLKLLSMSSPSISTDQSLNQQNTFHLHFHGNGVVLDQKTKTELTRFIDDYMSKAIRHRQAH